MTVAAGGKRLALKQDGARCARDDLSDPGDSGGRRFPRRKSEQQFVVLAAVERPFERGAPDHGHAVDLSRDLRFDAQAMQVEREAVAQVEAGSGAAAQTFAEGEARPNRAIPG